MNRSMAMGFCWLSVFVFAVSVACAEVDASRCLRKLRDVEELVSLYRRVQLVAPPVAAPKQAVKDVGSVVLDVESGRWPQLLVENLVPEQDAGGALCWPFTVCEDASTGSCRILNRDGRVIHEVAADAGYDAEWVFRRRLRQSVEARKAGSLERFKDLFSPSRVIMRGRFVVGEVSGARQTADTELVSEALPASSDSPEEAFSGVAGLMSFMEGGTDPHGISGEDPGFPPSGCKDWLYVQQGQSPPFLYPTSKNVRSLARASSCTLFVFADGAVSGVGYDPRFYDPCGELWTNPVSSWFSPPADYTNVAAVAADWTNYFIFLLKSGRVRGWGQTNNACGRGVVPAHVTNAVSVAAGLTHAVALLADGRVAEWGELGDEAPGVPVSVTNATAVAAGCVTTLALMEGGRVVEWGYYWGQSDVPECLTNAVEIAAGDSHSMARLEDGRVVVWGDNSCGQTNVPVSVTNAVAIAAGGYHCMALLADGAIVVWGDDSCGQWDIPDGIGGALGIHAAGEQCHALLEDGSAVVWGGWNEPGCPREPLGGIGADAACRVLQTAYSEAADEGWLTAVVRIPDGSLADDGDSDGLSLFDELYRMGTDPADADTDDDGMEDGFETEAPFVSLWEPADTTGRVFFCGAVKVTASGSARAALLRDGEVLVFTGEGAALRVHTNGCSAVDVDATDKWIAALLSGGDVAVWRENASGGLDETLLGHTNAVEIAGGLGHLLVRQANGKVVCVKEGTGGVPTVYAASGFSSVTNAVRIAAGTGGDAALLANNSVRYGDSMTTSAGFTRSYVTNIVDIAAGSNMYFAVLFSSGSVAAHKAALNHTFYSVTGAVAIAACGDSQLLAVMSDGRNGTFAMTATSWSYTSVTNRLLDARDLWWRRDCRLSVTESGGLSPLKNAVAGCRPLVYRGAAATPGGLRRGIALVTAGTCATNKWSDSDSLPDGWEVRYGLDPLDAADGSRDDDGDGLANYEECAEGTHPYLADTDGDGYWDGWEFLNGFNPADPSDTGADPDGDGLTNAREYILGCDRNSYDCDGDGLSDGAEVEVPFLTLWEPSNTIGRVFFCQAVQVTASDAMRAALLADRSVILFTGAGGALVAHTNACDAEEVEATDAWVAARTAGGDVRVWREVGGGAVTNHTMGFTNAVQISGGYAHLLVMHADGRVSCLKANAQGNPAVYTNNLCTAIGTNAFRVSAGTAADAAVLKNGRLRVGDALSTASTEVTPSPLAVDVAAGSNNCHVAFLAGGRARGYNNGGSAVSGDPTGVVFVAAGGSRERLAVLSDGRNASLASGATGWSYNTVVSNRLSDAWDLWWRRDCRLAVTNGGYLLALAASTSSTRRLDYIFAAATPRGLNLGIAGVCSGTCPTNRFTDADVLPDDWEVGNGLNPRDPSDQYADNDDDGLMNSVEYSRNTNPFVKDTDGDEIMDGDEAIRFGTDPAKADTDGDGLDDGREIEHVLVGSAGPWYNVAGGTNLVRALSYNLDEGLVTLALPFPVWFDGRLRTNATIGVNGAILLLTPGKEMANITVGASNQNMTNTVVNPDHVFIAGYWDDLYLYTNQLGSRISMADVTTNGSRYCIIEYKDMGLRSKYGYGDSAITNQVVSFQIVIPQVSSNRVCVNFQKAKGEADGRLASLGSQDAGASQRLAYSFNTNSVYAGLGLTYVFGTETDPQKNDTDGDGLKDGDEVHCYGTDPLNPDTDGDGMADGWEAFYAFNPVDPSDGQGDADSDGVSNLDEFLYGSNPRVNDTDDDGLGDNEEIPHIEKGVAGPWFDVSGGTNLVRTLANNLDTGLVTLALPFPIFFDGVIRTNITVSVDGSIFLLTPGRAAPTSWASFNQVLTNCVVSADHVFVAGYWDDLYLYTNQLGSKMSMADVITNGNRYCIIEYKDMGLRNYTGFLTNHAVSFQIVIPQASSNRVSVNFQQAKGEADGRFASLGIQDAGASQRLAYSYDTNIVYAGLGLTYVLGSETDPAKRDTDGDDLNDGEEFHVHGTNPSKYDSDGDRMSDGWELFHVFDPLDSSDGQFDADGDGVRNLDEFLNGTKPRIGDTDNDGLGDGEEVSHIETGTTGTWFDVSGGTNLVPAFSHNLDDGLATLALPFPLFFDGVMRTNITVSVNGAVWLLTSDETVPGGAFSSNVDLSGGGVAASRFHVFVAGFWDDLKLYPSEIGSAITVADVVTNGSRYCVIEYNNLGFAGYPATAANKVSFQIVLPQSSSNRVTVGFQSVSGVGNGSSASLGVQGVGASKRAAYSFNAAGAVYSGLRLTYELAAGTDPLERDQDNDGLLDGEEYHTYGTNPFKDDTDGDGLTDLDEIQVCGTDPRSRDSDGDGFDDGYELTVLDTNPCVFDGIDDCDGDEVLDILEHILGTNPDSAGDPVQGASGLQVIYPSGNAQL